MNQSYSISTVFRAIDKMSPNMKRMAANMQAFGKSARKMGSTMTTRVSAPIAAFGAVTIGSAVKFEAAMNKVEALSGETGKSLMSMRDMAKDLGATTSFSASQAADAMGFLSMAGWEANQVLAGTPAILNLAAASGTELARSADIASNIMGQFKIQAADASRVADVLSAATASANVDMEMLAESFKYAGPVANAFGMSLEETAAAVGMLGNIGIQGSSAGTALKNSMLQLVNPATDAAKMMTKLGVVTQDTEGKLLPLSTIMADFGDKIKDMGNGDQLHAIEMLFGKISVAGATELISQAQNGQLQKFAETLSHVDGRAEKMARTMMKGAPGAVKNLTSAFEGMMLSIAESGLLQWFTDITINITGLIRSISQTNPQILKWATGLAIVAAAAGPLLIAVGMMSSGLGLIVSGAAAASGALVAMAPVITGIVSGIAGLATTLFPIVGAAVSGAIAAVGSAFGSIGAMLAANPIGLAIAAIAAGAYLIYDNWDNIVSYFTDKFDAISSAFSDGFLQGLAKTIEEFNPFTILFDTLDGLIKYFTGFDLSAIMMEKINAMVSMLPDWAKDMLDVTEAPTALPQNQNDRVANMVRGVSQGRDARAKVDVNFNNVPYGTRVDSETSGDGLDFAAGVGYNR